MGKIEDAKNLYDNIEIPEELHEMVNRTIEKERMVHKHMKKKNTNRGKWGIYGAAAAAAALVIGLNTSSAFAAAAENVPVLGTVAKVLTFRSYDTDTDKTVIAEIPGVSIEGADVAEKNFTEEINAMIQEKCDTYLEGAIERVTEYKEAFIATGGTEEEFAAHNIEIKVGYEIKNQSEDILSFVVNGTESWTSAYAVTEYYNLNLKDLSYITLSDVLGENYVEIANQSIKAQMQAQEAEGGVVYWTEAEGGFVTVDENTNFYINEEGLPVIVFDKYQVAPGAAGMPEFVIDPSKPVEQAEGSTEAAEEAVSDTEKYREFAEEIRAAFLSEDIEKVADVMAYPTYVGIDEGLVIETREDFLAIAPEKLFTPEMKEAMENANFDNLEMTMAGVTIIDGLPSVTFNVTGDNTFGIVGINY